MSAIILALAIVVVLPAIALVMAERNHRQAVRKLKEFDDRAKVYHQAVQSGDPAVFEREYKNFEEYLKRESKN